MFAALLLVAVDFLWNSSFINWVERQYGYEAAAWVLQHKSGLAAGFLGGLFAVSWILVELYTIHQVDFVMRRVEQALGDTKDLKLPAEFSSLEYAVNHMKQENLRHQQEAKREVERKNDLITYLAHDIKTPMASVIGYLSLLEEAPELPLELRKKYVGITLHKANRLEELVDEFFDITRFNLSKLPLEKERLPLRFLMQQVVEEFAPVLFAGGKTVKILIDEEMKIHADPDKIARVFSNLLKNAAAYSYEKTVIVIQAEKLSKTDQTEITFANNGREIPEEKLQRIFDKFFRLDQARSSKTGGAGLGLAIAKEIVLWHEGKIFAESKDGRTIFHVILP